MAIPRPSLSSYYYNIIADEDIGSVVGYLKSLPPVDNDELQAMK